MLMSKSVSLSTKLQYHRYYNKNKDQRHTLYGIVSGNRDVFETKGWGTSQIVKSEHEGWRLIK